LGYFQCLGRFAENDRDDLCGAVADVQAHFCECASQVCRIVL
jgi:hypothetical protein